MNVSPDENIRDEYVTGKKNQGNNLTINPKMTNSNENISAKEKEIVCFQYQNNFVLGRKYLHEI